MSPFLMRYRSHRGTFCEEDRSWEKKIDCGKVNPASGCNHVVRGKTEEELSMNAKAHAKEHGIVEVTPQLIEMIKAHIEDE